MADLRALVILGLLALVFAASYLATHYQPQQAGLEEMPTASISVRDEAGAGLGGAMLLLKDKNGKIIFNGTVPYSKRFELNRSLEPYTYALECPAGYNGTESGELGTEPLVARCTALPVQNATPANATASVNVYDTSGGKISGAGIEVRVGGALVETLYTVDGEARISRQGNYTLIVRCPAGYLENFSADVRSDTRLEFVCTPAAAANASLSASPSGGSVEQGSSVSATISGSGEGLSCSGLPLHASCSFSPPDAAGASPSTLTIATSEATPLGAYEVVISGSYGDVTAAAAYNLTVVPKAGFDFSISLGSIGGAFGAGSDASVQVYASLTGGLGQGIALSCSGLPSGASCLFSPSLITPPAMSTLTIQTSPTTPAGTHSVSVSGTGGTLSRSRTYSLTVTAANATNVSADTAPPAAITAINVGSVTSSSVWLYWAAPGDDGSAGTASQYDIRYSASPITGATWASAAQASGAPVPAAAGTAQNVTIAGLSPSTTYYFAIKAADEVPNWSAISVVANATTASADTMAPSRISLMAAADPASSLVTLAWLAPGNNGSVGTAYRYDVRYSMSQITESNWAYATQASGEPAPLPAGTTQTFTVSGLLPSATYYFAIKASDEVPNWSELSNVVGKTTGTADYGPTPYVIKVLDLSYIPTISGKVDISQTGDWRDESISALTANIDSLRAGLIDTLVNGSVYHGYKNASATPSLAYDVIEKRIFYEPVPPSPTFKGMGDAPSADHIAILNGLEICNYVENLGVKEVWIWMYHTAQVAPIESNMAGPYGDISNSYREADLPVCAKTYTVYDYNYGRSYSMAVEDHTHQIEAILRYVDDNLFWNLFVGSGGRCGWTHYPPNGRWDYDWNNADPVMSDCEDWRPDNSGQKLSTGCSTWSTSPPACDSDEGLSFKRWWMQNLPGKNNGITYNGRPLKNWWVFIGKFDVAMGNRSLAE